MRNILITAFFLLTQLAYGQILKIEQDTSFVYLKCENRVCFTEVNFETDSFTIIEGKANIKEVTQSCLVIRPYSQIIRLLVKDSIYSFKTLLPIVSNNHRVFLDDKVIKDNTRLLKIDRDCNPCILRIEEEPNELMEYLFGSQRKSLVMRLSFALVRDGKSISYSTSGYTEFHDLSEVIKSSVKGDDIYIYTETVKVFCGDNSYYNTPTRYLIVININ